jgi:hypothetical protein
VMWKAMAVIGMIGQERAQSSFVPEAELVGD